MLDPYEPLPKEACIRTMPVSAHEGAFYVDKHIRDPETGLCMICGRECDDPGYRMTVSDRLFAITLAFFLTGLIVLFQWLLGGLRSH